MPEAIIIIATARAKIHQKLKLSTQANHSGIGLIFLRTNSKTIHKPNKMTIAAKKYGGPCFFPPEHVALF